MIPSPAELHYFLEVANTLNISRAAERLGIRQPTLSLAIQRLESSFGVPLLIRSKTGVQLTKPGTKLVLQVRNLLGEWEKLRGGALEDESRLSGRYTIGCHSSVAMFSLPHFLPALLRDFPGIEVKLSHDLSRKLTEDVISFKIDFGITVNPTAHPDLVIKTLCTDEVTFWVGPRTADREALTLQDPASGRGVLICEPDLLQTQSLLKQLSKKSMAFGRIIHTSNLEVVTALVASGCGVGILPTRVATRIKAMGLRPLSPTAPKFADRICLIYRADAQKSRASRELARLMESGLKTI